MLKSKRRAGRRLITRCLEVEISRQQASDVAGRQADGVQTGGGANRDRTGDLLVANQTLSQLSYGPDFGDGYWWVWEELHPRPHPYQGCALTN